MRETRPYAIVLDFYTTEPKIYVGDVVKLKSGGKSMTVTKLADKYIYVNFWENDSLQHVVFPKECVVRVQ